MRKTNFVIKKSDSYELEKVFNNTALIRSITGKKGLLNIKTNQIICEMDSYNRIEYYNKLFYLTKVVEKPTKENIWQPKKTITIYDTSNDKLITKGWEFVNEFNFDSEHKIITLKSPEDGKIHLFDEKIYQKNKEVFDMPLDNIERLNKTSYLILTVNGKKGLYDVFDENNTLKSPIEFDNIELINGVIIYTKENQKYFEIDKQSIKISEKFTDFTFDENNKNIMYCKKENKIHVYDINTSEKLFEISCHKIRNLSILSAKEEYIFETMNEDKYGIISFKKSSSKDKDNKLKVLVEPQLDAIKQYYPYDNKLYLKKDNKIGMLIFNSNKTIFIIPNYDKIVDIGDDYFALYSGELCDIRKISPDSENELRIINCIIVEDRLGTSQHRAIKYQQNNKLGILVHNGLKKLYQKSEDINIFAEYDNINYIDNDYYFLEQNNKKGLMHEGRIIIPTNEYDDIITRGLKEKNISFNQGFYLALKKGDKYTLAKKYFDKDTIEYLSESKFDKIDFLPEIIILRDEQHTYIYDYNETLLKTLPTKCSISTYERISKDSEKEYLYYIDGIYYCYKEGKFLQLYSDNVELHITRYETTEAIYSLTTPDEEKIKLFCQKIDSMPNEIAIQFLEKILQDGLSEEYSTNLVLKKTLKNY